MPTFPPHVERKRGLDLARARLRYMIYSASLHKLGKASMQQLAREAGCNHSTISIAITKGRFTQELADRVCSVIGGEHVRSEWLVDPLNIIETSAA